MNTVCRACAHELLPKQDQCPECGAEDAWSIIVDTAAAADLSWHRGWIGRVVGAGIAMAMLVGGARITLGGHAAMWTAVGGAFFLLGLALVVGAIRGVVERIRSGGQCPEGSLRVTRRMIHIDPDVLSSPLAAVDAVELGPTARADRWWLVLHLSPADACVLPRERTAMILKEFGAWALEGVSLDEAVAPGQGAWRVLLGGSRDDAEAVRARIDRLGADARRGRPVVDDGMVATLFPGSSPERVVAEGGTPRTRLIALPEGVQIVRDGHTRCTPWSEVTGVRVELEFPRPVPAADGAEPPWRWSVVFDRTPWRLWRLTESRWPRSFELQHADERAGVALWWALSRLRPASAVQVASARSQ